MLQSMLIVLADSLTLPLAQARLEDFFARPGLFFGPSEEIYEASFFTRRGAGAYQPYFFRIARI